jgi:hypothetical protein
MSDEKCNCATDPHVLLTTTGYKRLRFGESIEVNLRPGESKRVIIGEHCYLFENPRVITRKWRALIRAVGRPFRAISFFVFVWKFKREMRKRHNP